MGFGNFDTICQKVPIPVCPLVAMGNHQEASFIDAGIIAKCYSRSIFLANTTIFQAAACFIHICTLLILIYIVLMVRQKYTAIGRREIFTFFLICTFLSAWSLVVDAGVVPVGSGPYPYFVAVQNGLASAACLSLFISGLLGFQFYEDGTTQSVWGQRLASFVWFAIVFVISILTLKSVWDEGMSATNTTAMFIVLYVCNAVLVFAYIVSQLLLVVGMLHDYWAAGAIMLGVVFFVAGQILLYGFSATICSRVNHYIDGMFFATLCNLFTLMMVYKYWDMITAEDLEFSVSTHTMYDEKDAASLYTRY